MSDAKLRSSLIRLAHAKPELRGAILPLLKEAAGVLRWKQDGKTWEAEVSDSNGGVWAWKVTEVPGPGVPLYGVQVRTPDGDSMRWKRQVKTLSEAQKFAGKWAKSVVDDASMIMTNDFVRVAAGAVGIPPISYKQLSENLVNLGFKPIERLLSTGGKENAWGAWRWDNGKMSMKIDIEKRDNNSGYGDILNVLEREGSRVVDRWSAKPKSEDGWRKAVSNALNAAYTFLNKAEG